MCLLFEVGWRADVGPMRDLLGAGEGKWLGRSAGDARCIKGADDGLGDERTTKSVADKESWREEVM